MKKRRIEAEENLLNLTQRDENEKPTKQHQYATATVAVIAVTGSPEKCGCNSTFYIEFKSDLQQHFIIISKVHYDCIG